MKPAPNRARPRAPRPTVRAMMPEELVSVPTLPAVLPQCRTTESDAATSLAFTRNEDPVTVTTSPALPAELDRFSVARLVHANAAAPAMTVAVAADPKTTATFLRRFISLSPPLLSGPG